MASQGGELRVTIEDFASVTVDQPGTALFDERYCAHTSPQHLEVVSRGVERLGRGLREHRQKRIGKAAGPNRPWR